MMLKINNCEAVSFDSVPCVDIESFRNTLIQHKENDVLAFFPVKLDEKTSRLIAVTGDKKSLFVISTKVTDSYPALTPDIPAFHWFERELAEQHQITPEGHPWLKPIRFLNGEPGVTEYFKMDGDAVHEVAVGPIHAGVIEPGHFRFQCMGEKVYSLEISLGYQHRGIENMLDAGPDIKSLPLLETAAGDTSAAASTTFARLCETLADIKVPQNVDLIRQIAIELERLANHIGDLGALAGDVAYLPTASFCGRIRGDYLNLTAELCGNRFSRGFNNYGGIRWELDATRRERILAKLKVIYKDLCHALDLMFDSPTVLDRFENTGTVSLETARRIGLVGPAARASGIDINADLDYPRANASSRPARSQVSGGDVMARAKIRYEEIKATHAWLFEVLADTKCEQPVSGSRTIPALKNNMFAVSLTEAWRGTYCCCAVTGDNGKFRKCKVVDPSFHNWFGLAMALRNEEISNFPICNKSFNLSYCGHDL